MELIITDASYDGHVLVLTCKFGETELEITSDAINLKFQTRANEIGVYEAMRELFPNGGTFYYKQNDLPGIFLD